MMLKIDNFANRRGVAVRQVMEGIEPRGRARADMEEQLRVTMKLGPKKKKLTSEKARQHTSPPWPAEGMKVGSINMGRARVVALGAYKSTYDKESKMPDYAKTKDSIAI